ncbi:MAG: protoporphyrinogen oxidase [Vicinamibacterales bacterium]
MMIIIVGGGIAGLAAAHELARRDVPFILVEASDRAGGLILTEQVSGFTIDGGADSLLAQKPAAIQLCTELGLAHRLMHTTPPRTAFVLKKRLHALPSPSVLGIPTTAAGLARYDLLSWVARARIALEPLVPARVQTDESVASFFRRRFGRATVDLIAEPLLGGIHAGDVDRLSMLSLFPRLVAAEHRPGKVLRNVSHGRAPKPDGIFRALRSGMGELVTAILSQLPAGSVRLNAPAASLQRTAASWRLAAGSEMLDGAAVIIAAPAPTARELLGGVDDAAARICDSVPYVSTVSVALGFRRDSIRHPLAGSGFVVARRRNSLRITACTWASSKWESRAPEGHALLRAFIGGAHDPGAVDAGDAELVDVALRDLSGVLGISGQPVLARVYRWRNAGAQHHVGHRARMVGLGERLRALPGLFVAGSGFGSIGIPDCIAHGRSAAAAAVNYVRMRSARRDDRVTFT